MKLLIFIVVLVATSCSSLFAQDIHAVCGADEIHKEQYNNNARYRMGYDRTQDYLAKQGIKNYKTVTVGTTTEFHVPVIVHVMHTGAAIGTNYNPSVATINALITQLNRGFDNTYDNPSVTGTFNSTNIPIRFYLAQRTEACGATTGINRVDLSGNATYVASGVSRGGTNPGISDAALKAVVHWNDFDYYNIYIINKINGKDGYTTTSGSLTLGYAYPPSMGGNVQDGMVCLAFAAANPNSTTFIHELGHGFNLAHPFDGGVTVCPPNANCATDNDGVCDTEPMISSFTCNPTGNNPCTGLAYTGTQWNYMSYNGCTDRFTPGQSAKMLNALNVVRTSYKNSAGIDPPPAALPTAITAPTYNAANAGNFTNMGPVKVTFNAIEHTSDGYSFEAAGNQHYIDNTCNQGTTLVQGNTYTLEVFTDGNFQNSSVYIDYNNDGVFNTTNEQVMNSAAASVPQTHTANVVIPATAVTNVPLRMRVIADQSGFTITPTGTLQRGQAEDFRVTIITSVLPVVWRSVSANLNSNQNIDVRWSTEMEMNTEKFEIEKSKDGSNFYHIGTTKAAGNSELPSYYSHEDKTNVNEYNYYRIKMVDIDGQISYSKTVSEIIKSNELEIVLFPNPTSGKLHINLVGMNADVNNIQYAVTDLNGQVWIKKTIETIETKANIHESIASLADGMYFVHMNINGILSTYKIIKQF